MCESYIDWLSLAPNWGPACNPRHVPWVASCDVSVHRPALDPMSHADQVSLGHFPHITLWGAHVVNLIAHPDEHSSPIAQKEREQKPIHRIFATITSFTCHFSLAFEPWSCCPTVWWRWGRLALGWSDLMFDVNTKYQMLMLTPGKCDGENTAVFGKVLLVMV